MSEPFQTLLVRDAQLQDDGQSSCGIGQNWKECGASFEKRSRKCHPAVCRDISMLGMSDFIYYLLYALLQFHMSLTTHS